MAVYVEYSVSSLCAILHFIRIMIAFMAYYCYSKALKWILRQCGGFSLIKRAYEIYVMHHIKSTL